MSFVKMFYLIKYLEMDHSDPGNRIEEVSPIIYDSYEDAVNAVMKRYDRSHEAGKIKVLHNDHHLLSAPTCTMLWEQENKYIIYSIFEVKLLKVEETE